MTDLFQAATIAEHEAACQPFPHLQAGTTVSRRMLDTAMIAAFGGGDTEGPWTQQDSFEVLELSLALYLRAASPSRDRWLRSARRAVP